MPTADTGAGAADAPVQIPGHTQRRLTAYGPIAAHFCRRRHRMAAYDYRQTRAERFAA